MRAAESVPQPTPNVEELSLAATRSIRAPLAALRASMEAMVRELDRSDPRATALRGALDEVVRLGRSVQALVDYALPPPLRPLSCSLREIAHAALAGLDAGHRTRVLAAVELPQSRVDVDGPLVARCLGHWLTVALESTSGPVLVRARTASGDLVFTLLGPARRDDRAVKAPAPHETGSHALSQALACREVARMGGSLATRVSHATLDLGGETWIAAEVRVPIRSTVEERA